MFLTVGYYVGQDTPFAAIRTLPPAGKLTWGPGGLIVASQPRRFATVSMTRELAIEEAIERTRTAVARCLPDDDAPFLLPVSGGRDSRQILLELIRAGRAPAAGLTVRQYPTDWGGDAPYGEGLCRALGIKHRTLQPGPMIAAEWRKNRLTNYCADEHAWYLPVVDALRGASAFTYDGLGGGMLLHRDFMTRAVRRAWRAGTWDELAAKLGLRDEYGTPRSAPLVEPSLRSALGPDVAAARIRRELGRHLDADNPYLSYTLNNRTVREIALVPTSMLASVTTAFTPFTDPDFVAFAASIPNELAGTRLHTEIIATAFPKVASVPYVPKRRPAADRRFRRRTARDLAGLLRRRSDGSLVDRSGLLRRATISSLTGDGWLTWGRRAALTAYLVQLESIRRGESPDRLDATD